jgi:hypothetical protein
MKWEAAKGSWKFGVICLRKRGRRAVEGHKGLFNPTFQAEATAILVPSVESFVRLAERRRYVGGI